MQKNVKTTINLKKCKNLFHSKEDERKYQMTRTKSDTSSYTHVSLGKEIMQDEMAANSRKQVMDHLPKKLLSFNSSKGNTKWHGPNLTCPSGVLRRLPGDKAIKKMRESFRKYSKRRWMRENTARGDGWEKASEERWREEMERGNGWEKASDNTARGEPTTLTSFQVTPAGNGE